jgi:hypothetical protein
MGATGRDAWPPGWPLLLFAALAALSVGVYWPALGGPFVSDDYGYIAASPYTSSLGSEALLEILDPRGQARLFTANYAPVHLLLTALERQIFADEFLGYHLVNVLAHALCCTLLAALLRQSGVPTPGVLLGTGFFALHPANVEAVAWISQLKTSASLALALGALVSFRRRPGLATALFATALLTKASAAAVLPAAAAQSWAWAGEPGAPAGELRRRGRWLAGWLLLLGGFAAAELSAHAATGHLEVAAFADRRVQLRTMAAVGARYLAMAATSFGVSAFQEPPPALSPFDPWWLLALPLAALLAGRTALALRRRREEAAFWVLAAASFAPVSQIAPFVNPVADRYLYFVLPGLIGGALLAGGDLLARHAPAAARRRARQGLLAASALLLAFFGARSAERAALWQSEIRLLLDAARHYPEGGTAAFLRARRAAQEGDALAAVAELRTAEAGHAARFTVLLEDPGLRPLRGEPAFEALLAEMAGRWIERSLASGIESQPELRVRALAHQVRGEWELAAATLERALRAGGPQDELVRGQLARVRDQLAARRGAPPAGAGAGE